MEQFSNLEVAILESLGRFQYLTTTQFMALEVTKNKRHLYAILQKLEGKKYSPIKKLNFGVLPNVGKLHSIYHLTPRGAEVLEQASLSWVRYPKSSVMFTRDYFHRIGCVDVHIAFEQWANKTGGFLTRFETYYDRGRKSIKGRATPRTTVRWQDNQITPDGICLLTGSDEVERLCAIELHRGRDMLRLDKQLLQYAKAIEAAAIETAYDYKAAVRIILIFTDPPALKTCQKRMQGLGLSGKVLARFFLKTTDELADSLIEGWQDEKGNKKELFEVKSGQISV